MGYIPEHTSGRTTISIGNCSTASTSFVYTVSAVGTCTVSIANPAVISRTAHGLSIGDAFTVTTTGALPTGMTAGSTPYYVISAGFGVNSFEFSATFGGSAINTSGSQSGTHTLNKMFAVTIATKTTALVSFFCTCTHSSTGIVMFDVLVSGASNLYVSSLTDTARTYGVGGRALSSIWQSYSFCILVTGLTPGENTFQVKWKVNGGTATMRSSVDEAPTLTVVAL